jgi:hypothetical protein
MVDFLPGESPSKPTSGGLALTHAGRLWNDPYAVGIDWESMVVSMLRFG